MPKLCLFDLLLCHCIYPMVNNAALCVVPLTTCVHTCQADMGPSKPYVSACTHAEPPEKQQHMLQNPICTYPASPGMQLQPLSLEAVCLHTCVWPVASAVAGDVFSVLQPPAPGLPEGSICSLPARSLCVPAGHKQAMRPTPAQHGKAMPKIVTM